MGMHFSFHRLSNKDLTDSLGRLVRNERRATAALVACLEAFDRRRLFLGHGFCSLFAYCRDRLHLSEDAACSRIEVARAIRRHPEIIDMLSDGRLSITTAALLVRKVPTAEVGAMLARAAYKSKRDVERLIAEAHPLPPLPSVLRPLPDRAREVLQDGVPAAPRASDVPPADGATAPVPAPATAQVNASAGGFTAGSSDAHATPAGAQAPAHESMPAASLSGDPSESAAAAAAAADNLPQSAAERASTAEAFTLTQPPERRAVIAPLSATHYKLQVTISALACERLHAIQDLMRHRLPSGDPAAIVEHALEVLQAELLKRKIAQVSRPRRMAGNTDPAGRYIPAAVQRAVWRRDQGRCAFVGEGGRRCGSAGTVEFHHVRPFAVGGSATVANIELRCRAHNRFEWTQHLDEETLTLASR